MFTHGWLRPALILLAPTLLSAQHKTPVITVPASVSAGSTVAASVPSTVGSSYYWSITGGTFTTARTAPSVTFTAGTGSSLGLTCKVTCSEGVSKSGSATVSIVGAPIISAFSAANPTITAGSGTTLNWTVSGATSLKVDPGLTVTAAQTSVAVAPTATTTYTLTATNDTGLSASAQTTVTVVPAPSASLTADATSLAAGQGTTLHASCANGTAVIDNGVGAVSNGWSGPTGALDASRTYTLTVTNAAGTTATSAVTVTVAASTAPPPTASGVYGSGWAGDSLNNYPIGGSYGRKNSFRFRADHTGSLQTLRVFWVDNRGSSSGGYALGNGGTIKVDIQPDDGSAAHLPSGTSLGYLINKPNLSSGVDPLGNAGVFRLMTFPTAIPVVGGNLYHVVFTNVDADPVNNWISVNGIVDWTTEQPQAQLPATDFSVLMNTGSGWKEGFTTDGKASINVPILDFGYGDGGHQGNGYMEIWIGQPRVIGGVQSVREVFIPTADVTVSGVATRVLRTSSGGTLVYRLEKADGTLVQSVSVDGSLARSDKYAFVKAAFPAAVTLKAGQAYNLVLQAPAGSFSAYPIRDGGPFGFAAGTVFKEGHCEFNTGSGWQGWDGWTSSGSSSYVYGDLQFYFQTVQ